MRKMITMLFALGVGLLVYQPTMLAAESDIEVEEKTEVNSLSIDTVVERGLKQNSILLLLDYQIGILGGQKKQLELDRDNLSSDLEKAIDKRRELRNQRDSIDDMISDLTGDMGALKAEINTIQLQLQDLNPVEDEALIAELNALLSGYQAQLEAMGAAISEGSQAIGPITQGIDGLMTQVEALEDGVIQLDLAVNKLVIGELKLEYEVEETKALMEMMLKSNYIQLISMKEQQQFQKQMMQQVEKEISMMQRRVELGLESSFEVEKAQREIETQKQDILQLEKDFQRQLAKLALDINISYREDVELLPIDLKGLLPIQRQDIDSLILRSYALKKSEQDLETAKLELENARSEGTRHEVTIAEYGQKVAEKNKKQLFVDSRKHIEDLYFDAEKTYKEIETKKRNLEYVESDNKKLQRQYELGLLSRYQTEQAEVQLKQAAFELRMSEISYYILLEQVRNMHAGVLQ